jgi:hypothetical protein
LHILSKPELLDFIAERREIFDAQENPFASADWLTHFVREIGRSEWQYIVPERIDLGESMMMLYEEKPGHLRALTNVYASRYSPIVSARDGSATALIEQLTTFYRPSTLVLEPIAADEAAALRFPAGHYVRRYHRFQNWYLPCAGMAFDEYMAGRPSQLQNTWKRKQKKFAGRLEIISAPHDVERGIAAHEHIYARSWKVPEPYPNFVAGWARICAGAGTLRLGVAWLGETPIAASFWFLWRGRAYIFKLAYDENSRQLSAGTLLTAHLLKHALEADRVSEIDYLSGDDTYKRDWMSHRRELVGIIACRLSSAAGMIRAVYEWTGTTRQRLLRMQTPTPDAV